MLCLFRHKIFAKVKYFHFTTFGCISENAKKKKKKKKKNSSVFFHNKLKKFHNLTSKQPLPVLEKTNPPPL